jgi:hypothetical protein
MNSMRQPIVRAASSVGAVAISSPRAPNDMTQALASARRGATTHRTMALNPLISPPEKPNPINARAAVKVSASLP